jgi:hypothetical protein
MAENLSYFSYTDANGGEVIVHQLKDVPAASRASVKHIDLSKPGFDAKAKLSAVATQAPSAGAGLSPLALHKPSFLIGVGVTVVFGVLAALVLRRATRVFMVLLGLAIAAGSFTVYLTFLRKQTGLGSGRLATPATLLDDARAAAEAVDRHHKDQDRAFDELENQR